jgi:hypothetical protein
MLTDPKEEEEEEEEEPIKLHVVTSQMQYGRKNLKPHTL